MLTKGERKALEKMVRGEELVQAVPGGWWFDNHQISGRIGWSLLRKVFISEIDTDNENYRRYHINEWGRDALVHPAGSESENEKLLFSAVTEKITRIKNIGRNYDKS